MTAVEDDTMQESADNLAAAIVGHKITEVERNVLTLDNGTRVTMIEEGDCCAGTDLTGIERLTSLDHVITAVRTENGYTEWYIVAGMVDVLKLDVDWSEGSGYYQYGFTIKVEDAE